MYAKELFLGITPFGILICIGVLSALFVFDKMCKVRGISDKSNQFYYILSVVTILGGFGIAVLFQSTYNYIEAVRAGKDAVFELGGMTFLGGLIGGAAIFVGGFLLFAKRQTRNDFYKVAEIGPVSITLAHAFGRIGCFFAGCCYGKEASGFFSFLGVNFLYGDGQGVPRYPTQLFESAFLFLLCAVLVILNKKDKRCSLITYFFSYGIFRFILEFLRDDDRGALGFSLSPSQIMSIVIIVIGGLLCVLKWIELRRPDSYAKFLKFFKIDRKVVSAEDLTKKADN